MTVIGVAADSRDQSGALIPAAYVPLSQQYEPAIKLAVRTSADPAAIIPALRTIGGEVDPTLGVIDAGNGSQLAGTDNVVLEVMAALTGTLGAAAMILAMLGLYGVLSFVVAQRTHEIGVRVALGATSDHIARLIVGEGVRPVIEGLVIGFVIADLAEMIMSPTLRTPLPTVDGLMLIVLPIPFLAAAGLASYLPSQRAAAVDPAVALRRE
jgi:putative ABC transport system permease protein